MNVAPHTHKLAITKAYGAMLPSLEITYGDQTGYLWTWFPGWRSRLDRKIKRMINHHDAASKVAHKSPEAVKDIVAQKHNAVLLALPEHLRGKTGYTDSYYQQEQKVWGSDLLKEVPKQTVPVE